MASKHLKVLKKRTVFLLVIFAVLYLAIAGRLFYIQVIHNGDYRRLANQLRLRELVIPASRGAIYDRVGRELATNVPACSIYAQPCKIKDKDAVAGILSNCLKVDRQTVLGMIDCEKKFVYLGHSFPADTGDAVRKANLTAIGVLPEPKRVYPSGNLASHILGFTNSDGRGIEGIEKALNNCLTGKDGCTVAELDSNGRIIPETRRQSISAVNGQDIILTIDANLQHITEEALYKTFKAHNAVGATAIVMDPRSGEILALANCPSYDPNNRRGVSLDAMRDRAVTDLYEPGSTLKAITVAAGLEEGIPAHEVVATCVKCGMPIGKRKVRCTLHAPYLGGHGAVDMYGIIKNSCNIGAAAVALRLGPDKLYAYDKAFGLFDRPGSGLAGEAKYPLPSPDTWETIRLANVGFGQGISVTPIQMACAYSAIANGGNLMQPQIIREMRSKDGKTIKPFAPKIVRRVISAETSRLTIDMMAGCVDEGTGKPSKVDGYSVAGKTGSAQKASTTGRGYASGKFVASFMGLIPASRPRLVICVVVDEPKGTHWGATVAAPVFKEIAQQAMWYLQVPPDQPLELEATPGDSGHATKKAHAKLGAAHTG